MSNPNVHDAVLAERRRILKILYRGSVALPGAVEGAINCGQDPRTFCPERVGEAEALEAAAASAEPAIAAVASTNPWSEITAGYNAQRRAAIAMLDEESAP